MYKNILLPIDGSQNSLNAVEQAIELIKSQPNASVTVLHVLPPNYFFTEACLATASVNIDLDEDARNYGNDLLQHVGEKLKASGIPYQLKLEKGIPAQKICEHAEDGQYDLIIMGSRGLGGFSEFVLGSVSHKVLTHVKTPALVVR